MGTLGKMLGKALVEAEKRERERREYEEYVRLRILAERQDRIDHMAETLADLLREAEADDSQKAWPFPEPGPTIH